MKIAQSFLSALSDRLGLLLLACICSTGFAATAGLLVFVWSEGGEITAVLLGAVWLIATLPWMGVLLYVGFDSLQLARGGGAILIPFFAELRERSKSDPSFSELQPEPSSFGKALVLLGGLTNPLAPIAVAGTVQLRHAKVNERKVIELITLYRDALREKKKQRRMRRLARPIAKLAGRSFAGVDSVAAGYT